MTSDAQKRNFNVRFCFVEIKLLLLKTRWMQELPILGEGCVGARSITCRGLSSTWDHLFAVYCPFTLQLYCVLYLGLSVWTRNLCEEVWGDLRTRGWELMSSGVVLMDKALISNLLLDYNNSTLRVSTHDWQYKRQYWRQSLFWKYYFWTQCILN